MHWSVKKIHYLKSAGIGVKCACTRCDAVHFAFITMHCSALFLQSSIHVFFGCRMELAPPPPSATCRLHRYMTLIIYTRACKEARFARRLAPFRALHTQGASLDRFCRDLQSADLLQQCQSISCSNVGRFGENARTYLFSGIEVSGLGVRVRPSIETVSSLRERRRVRESEKRDSGREGHGRESDQCWREPRRRRLAALAVTGKAFASASNFSLIWNMHANREKRREGQGGRGG